MVDTQDIITLDSKRPVTALNFLDAWAKAAEDTNRTPDATTRAQMHEFTFLLEQSIFNNARKFGIKTTDFEEISPTQDGAAKDKHLNPTDKLLNAVTLNSQNIGTLYSGAQRMEAAAQAGKNKHHKDAPDFDAMLEKASARNFAIKERFAEITNELGLERETALDPKKTKTIEPQTQAAARA